MGGKQTFLCINVDFEFLLYIILFCLYPMDFKMHRDGKGVNPREHSKRCDRGERAQPTKRQLEG